MSCICPCLLRDVRIDLRQVVVARSPEGPTLAHHGMVAVLVQLFVAHLLSGKSGVLAMGPGRRWPMMITMMVMVMMMRMTMTMTPMKTTTRQRDDDHNDDDDDDDDAACNR